MLSNTFTKDNLDLYLKELAKEFKRLNGKKMPAEIILIGGAAILANYNFRESTSDMDAIIYASSAMKDAIHNVAEKYQLPSDWLNCDFMRTSSYSPNLIKVSKYYRTFSNVVSIRTISAEYLIAMKLKSARKYKNDLSDIVGILKEHKENNQPITFERIDRAIIELYGSWSDIAEEAVAFIKEVTKEDINYDDYFLEKKKDENENRLILLDFEEKYPKVLKNDNLENILQIIKKKNEKNS